MGIEFNEKIKEEFVNRKYKQKFKEEYSNLYRYIYLVYWNQDYMDRLFNKKHEIFNEVPCLDYVIELSAAQMPLDYIIENIKEKKEIIPNISQRDRFDNNNDNTMFERITIMELLGCFAKVDKSLIKELEDNGFKKYDYVLKNGESKTITINDLLDKMVIFMCPENIEIAYNNLISLSEDQLINLLDNHDFEIFGTQEQCIKKLLNNSDDLLKIVFYHECGHSAFYKINSNPSKINNTPKIHERQANYYTSIVLDGQYDLLVEIMNNRIGNDYKNPLLKSHEFTKGIVKFKEEQKKYMSNIEWKNQQQLDNHYNKHVLGNGLEKYNKDEPKIWIDNNYGKKVSKEEYENKSKDNMNGNHYLCKDKSSKTISINYYNSNNEEDYLLTCTKIEDSDLKIYSCYFTNIEHIHPFMNIYYFVNIIKKVSNEDYISVDFTKYEINDNKFDRYYKCVIKECNLDNPKYSTEEEITLFQMGFLKQFLNENLHSKKNNRDIWINKLLKKKLDSILENKTYELNEIENNELKTIYNDIKQYAEDKNIYIENKDAIDLLIEINNLINDKHIIKFPFGETSRWTMFNNFKKWKNKDIII